MWSTWIEEASNNNNLLLYNRKWGNLAPEAYAKWSYRWIEYTLNCIEENERFHNKLISYRLFLDMQGEECLLIAQIHNTPEFLGWRGERESLTSWRNGLINGLDIFTWLLIFFFRSLVQNFNHFINAFSLRSVRMASDILNAAISTRLLKDWMNYPE